MRPLKSSGRWAVDRVYDLIIIGGGPAGLAAGLYASRARLSTLLIERAIFGGQIANAAHVENYPGFPDGISGLELSELMHKQATKYGLKTLDAAVTAIELSDKGKVAKTSEGEYQAKALIIAGGAEPNKLGVPGEERLLGRGVSYCATCDGPLFRERVVAVVGGGDSAVEEALVLTRFASKVFLIHRRHQLRAGKIIQERAFANPKIEFLWDTVVEEVLGKDKLEGLSLRNVKMGAKMKLEVSGVFIYVGLHPSTEFLKGLIPLDSEGRIPVNDRMETQIAGIFAAGDIRQNSSRQAITAAGDGATAALSAERFLSQQR